MVEGESEGSGLGGGLRLALLGSGHCGVGGMLRGA